MYWQFDDFHQSASISKQNTECIQQKNNKEDKASSKKIIKKMKHPAKK